MMVSQTTFELGGSFFHSELIFWTTKYSLARDAHHKEVFTILHKYYLQRKIGFHIDKNNILISVLNKLRHFVALMCSGNFIIFRISEIN